MKTAALALAVVLSLVRFAPAQTSNATDGSGCMTITRCGLIGARSD